MNQRIASVTVVCIVLVASNCSLSYASETKAESLNTVGPAEKTHKVHYDGVIESVLIKASPKVVWSSMMEQRKSDPESEYCKSVVNPDDPSKDYVEQKFKFPSAFGDAECVLKLVDTPEKRVDFKMMESEDLKKMEGSWILTPVDDGTATKLELQSYVEPHMLLPRLVLNALMGFKARKNLRAVKQIAEKHAL